MWEVCTLSTSSTVLEYHSILLKQKGSARQGIPIQYQIQLRKGPFQQSVSLDHIYTLAMSKRTYLVVNIITNLSICAHAIEEAESPAVAIIAARRIQ
jgi:hypothetical protein